MVDVIDKTKEYKREWMRKKRAGVETTTVPSYPEPKEGHCRRCEILFIYGGYGDGKKCDECLNELGII